jgi:hypothetical protein
MKWIESLKSIRSRITSIQIIVCSKVECKQLQIETFFDYHIKYKNKFRAWAQKYSLYL